MRLAQRIGSSLSVFAIISGLDWLLAFDAGWILFAAGFLCIWKIGRDIYLFVETITADIVYLRNGSKEKKYSIKYVWRSRKRVGKRTPEGVSELSSSDLCRIDVLPVRPWIIVYMLVRPQVHVDPGSGTLYRPITPLGVSWRYELRRFLVFSMDVLLQSKDGHWLLLPLAAYDLRERRELWLGLRTHAPEELRPHIGGADPKLLQAAWSTEEEAGKEQRNNRWAKASEKFSIAESSWEQAGSVDGKLRCLVLLGECEFSLGHVNKAWQAADKALTLAKNISSDLTVDLTVANIASFLGGIAMRIGGMEELVKAHQSLKEAIEIYKETGNRFLECRMRSNLALIEEERERRCSGCKMHNHKDLSQDHVKKALDLLEEGARGPNVYVTNMQKANLLGTMGRWLFRDGDYRGALAKFRQQEEIGGKEGAFPEDLPFYGMSLIKLGGALPGSALERANLHFIDEGLRKLDEGVKLARRHGDLIIYIDAKRFRGDSFWELGNYQAAVRDYKEVIEHIEYNQPVLTQLMERTYRLSLYQDVYERAIEGSILLAEADRDTTRRAELEDEALCFSELLKARALSASVSLSELWERMLPKELRDTYNDCLRRLIHAQRGLQRAQRAPQDVLQDKPEAPEDYNKALEELREAEQSYGDVTDRIGHNYPDLAGLGDSAPASVQQLRAILPTYVTTAVAVFAVTETSLIIFLITNTKSCQFTTLRIPNLGRRHLHEVFLNTGFLKEGETAAAVGHAVSEIRSRMVQARGVDGRCLQDALREAGVEKLVIIPDGILHRLPLHAAIEEIEDVSYCLSCSALVRVVGRRVGKLDSALVVAAYDARQGTLEVDGPPYDDFQIEGALVADLLEKWGVHPNSIGLGYETVTKKAIRNALRHVTLFHFAGHGKSNALNPLASCLKIDSRSKTAGILTANEMLWAKKDEEDSSLSMPPGGVVVLSACETAVVPEAADDPTREYMGFPAIFLFGGASTVVATLWPVCSFHATVMMKAFYMNLLKENARAGPALGHAWRNLRDLRDKLDGEYFSIRRRYSSNRQEGRLRASGQKDCLLDTTHPFHWASYILYGADWGKEDALDAAVALKPLAPNKVAISGGWSPEAQVVLAMADALIAQKRFQEAARHLEQALHTAPEWAPTFSDRLSVCYAAVGDEAKAIECQKKVIEADPNDFVATYNLGCTLRDLGRISEAREAFRKAIDLNPAYAAALYNLAQILNDPAQSLEYLRKTEKAEPADKDVRPAIEMWQELSELSPDDIIRFRIVQAAEAGKIQKFEMVRFQLAVCHADEKLMNAPIKASLRAAEADFLRQQSLMPEADPSRQRDLIEASVKKLGDAIDLDPSVAFYWNNRGARRLHFADYLTRNEANNMLIAAETDCRRAITCGDYARPHYNLANIRIKQHAVTGVDQLLIEAETFAGTSLNMAHRQLAARSNGELLCKGCPTLGENREECQQCIVKASRTLNSIGYATGNYRF